jgi:hypothetical protein
MDAIARQSKDGQSVDGFLLPYGGQPPRRVGSGLPMRLRAVSDDDYVDRPRRGSQQADESSTPERLVVWVWRDDDRRAQLRNGSCGPKRVTEWVEEHAHRIV